MEGFQRDSYLDRLDATVVSCTPVEGAFDVRLSETIAYPESGGQPSDAARIDGVEVLSLRKDQGVVHRLKRAFEESQPVSVTIDWARRFDFMQQHSAQHLLTALAEDNWGWRTTSFHLGDDYSAIELDVGDLTAGELARLETRANEAIREARPVDDRWVDAAELGELEVRSRGLPDGHVGPVRLVEIEGVDLTTCGGTHVRSTAEIQMIHLTGRQAARGGTRVTFVAGVRALQELRDWTELQSSLSDALSVGPTEYLERIEKLDNDRREASRDADRAWDEWAEASAREVRAEGGPIVIDLEVGRLDLLAKVAQAADPAAERLFFGTAGEDEVLFLLRGPADRVAELGPRVAAALEGRGGGQSGRFQGKGRRSSRTDALELIKTESA